MSREGKIKRAKRKLSLKSAVSSLLIASTIALNISAICAPPSLAKSSAPRAAVSSKKKEDVAGCRTCVSQAAGLFASNQLEKAAALLREWSPRCPGNAQLHLLLSSIVLRLGVKTDEALQEAALACTASPDSQAAHMQYGMMLQASEKYSQAATEFEFVTSINPGSYEAWSALSDIYKRLRQDDEAKSAAVKAGPLEPGTQAIRLSVLQNLKRAGKNAQARKELQRLLSDTQNGPEFEQFLAIEALQLGAYDEAIEASSRVIKAYPGSPGPQKILAISQLLKHQHPDAEATASKFVIEKAKGEKQKGSGTLSSSGEGLAIRALARMEQGKFQEADQDAARALATEPSSNLVMLADGLAKIYRGDFENAGDQLQVASDAGSKGTALDKIPQSMAHLALSHLYRKQGLLAESIQEAHAAAADKRFESEAIAYEARAVLEDNARPDYLAKANSLAVKAVSADSSNANSLISQAMCELKNGNADAARKLALKATELAPFNADSHLTLARISNAQGDAPETEKRIARAMECAPKDPEVLAEKARSLLKQNKSSEAADLLKQAFDHVVRKPEMSYLLAEACEKNGDKTESLKYYKLSLNQGLSGDSLAQAKAAISRLETK